MKFSIRRVREEDAAPIAALLNVIIEAGLYTIMSGPLTVDDILDYMRENREQGLFNVAVSDDDGAIVGTQSIDPFSASVTALKHVGDISTFVAVGLHGKGIGAGISRETFRQAKDVGFLKIMATIRADNPQAIAFYRGQGFRVIGTARHHAYIDGRYIDEIIAEKMLDEE